MLRDLGFAFRLLFKTKAWTAVVLLSLALGIGVNTTLFSAINALLLRTIYAQNPGELVRLRWVGKNQMATRRSEYGSSRPSRSGQRVRSTISYPIYQQLRSANETMTDLFACAPLSRVNLIVKGEAELASAFVATGNYFQVLGVPAYRGRTITASDDRKGASPVAMISHGYWQRRFGADPKTIGMQVTVNGIPVTIVGVTPPGYVGVQRLGAGAADLHLPMALEYLGSSATPGADTPGRLSQGTFWWLQVVGRLKPGVFARQVEGNLNGVFQEAARAGWDDYFTQLSEERRSLSRNQNRKAVPRLDVASAAQGVYDQPDSISQAIAILGVVVGIVLLIVCANVANLLLSRAALRRNEISIRLSLGASRMRLIRQLLTESLLLSGLGAALGLGVAFWSRRLLPGGEDFPLDWRVFAFAAGLGLATGLLFGTIPALKATGLDLSSATKETSRSLSRSRTLLGKSLLVVQVAMSLALLIGAGLFLRTLRNLHSVRVGFNTENLLLVRVDAGVNGYDKERSRHLYEQMQAAFEAIPGVQSVSRSAVSLLSGGVWTSSIHTKGEKSDEGRDAHMMIVSPEFFQTLQIPILLGRGFTRQDNDESPKVALINQPAARLFFGTENPLGRRYGHSPEKHSELQVIGVIAGTKYNSIRDEAPPTVYQSVLQDYPFSFLVFELRTGPEARSLIPAVRETVHRIDPRLPLAQISTQAEQVEERLSQERLFARVFSLFGGLAVSLACIGLFGLMSYSVARRTNEIGIRMALGAGPGKVSAMILRESMLLVAAGCLVGLAAAFGAGRFVASLLYELAPTDPLSMAAAVGLMILVAGVAAWIPARRASRVDPMIALHYE